MPLYEFRCQKCGKEFEERRLFAEAEKPAKCPKCGGTADKLISGFGLKMGFYTRPPDRPFRDKQASTWSDGPHAAGEKDGASKPRSGKKTGGSKAKRGK